MMQETTVRPDWHAKAKESAPSRLLVRSSAYAIALRECEYINSKRRVIDAIATLRAYAADRA